MREPNPRTQTVVDRQYQVRFAMQLVYAVFTIALVAFLVSVAILWLELRRNGAATEGFFVDAVFGAVTVLSIELIVAVPFIYFLGLRTSHRVAGPAVRIKRTLAALGEGKFDERIKLREGDALVDIADAINQMAEQLEKRG